jgi:hypothetical protein
MGFVIYSRAYMDAINWDNERTELRMCFTRGDIARRSRADLEWALVVLANSLWGGDPKRQDYHKSETEAFSDVIRHLLAIRLGEELHAKSHRVGVRALKVAYGSAAIALVSAVFSGLLWWTDFRKPDSAIPARAVPATHETSSPSTPAKALATESKAQSQKSQSPRLKSILTNQAADSQDASTNR